MGHYEKDLTEQEYQEEYEAAVALTFGEQGGKKVYCVLDSLDGIVEMGCGKDEQSAREDYIHKLEMLIHELNEKRVKVQYKQVDLEYTHFGGV